jgi:tetratricopeptide (TPR) repeat protein
MLARLHDATHHQVGLLETGRIQEKALFIGFAADGFYRYWLLSRDPRAVTGIVAAATLLYKGDMVLPTGMPRYSLIPTVDGPWAVFQPHWDEVDQPATRAYQVTGDRKYLDWGKAPMDTLLNYKRIANRFTGLGSTVPEYLACLREAGLTQDDLARMRSDRDYDKALAELKPIAEAKYAITPSGESRAYCMLAEEVGRVLINLGRRDEAVAWLEHWEKNSQAYDVHPFLEHARALPESRKPAPP